MTRNLPARLTRFFGRDAERAELESIVGRARLLTLTGAPGCGKTRLSLELSDQLESQFRDGVRLVELAPISDPAGVANAVAAALGVAEETDRPPGDTLADALAAAELLLVVDNCEHVADASAELVRHLLAGCPALHVLCTSRVALGLPGEQVWQVEPLAIGPAVELFLDRAQLAARALHVGDVLAERICRRLDGLPLAIELAAAWTRVLSPGEILDRLDAAAPLLRPIETAVDWSCRLLRPHERRLFERLAVFAGGFDLKAAEAVAESDDALSDLTALVDHSLVLAEPTADGPMRYRLLEPVRQCAAAGGVSTTVRRLHAEHYLDLARSADIALRGDQRAAALRRLAHEEGNLLAALEWARAECPDVGLRLCVALARFWELRGRVNDGRARLEELLALDTSDRRLRAAALSRAGRLAWRERDYSRARALLEQSAVLVRGLGDQPGLARRLRSLALVAMSEGHAREAVQLCEGSIPIFRAQDDRHGLVWAQIYLGWARYIEGDLDAGDRQMREALELNRPAGSVAARVNALLGVAYGAARAGDVETQREHVVAALEILRDVGGLVEEPDWLWAGAGLAVAEGRLRAACRLAGAAEALGRRGGTHLNEQFIPPLPPGAGTRRAMIEGARMTLDELMAEAIAEPGDDPLSPREREVVELVAEGLSNVEIARRLVISKRTVESHVEHIKQKLGHRTRHEVMAWALRFRTPESA